MSSTNNILLSCLSDADVSLLAPHLTTEALKPRQVLGDSYACIDNVYFLSDGIASIVSIFDDGSEAEVGIVGREGMIGSASLLGVDRSPYRTYMQINGTRAHRIPVKTLKRKLTESPTLKAIFLKYVQVFSVQTGHTAAVNCHFDIPKRLARWLLMCHDRTDGLHVVVTHEVLSIMLGVRRPSVTEAMTGLEKIGAVSGGRGRVSIIDREKLEAFAGDAYGLPESEYRRLVAPFGKSSPTPPIPNHTTVRLPA